MKKTLLFLLLLVSSHLLNAQQLSSNAKPIVLNSNYEHDKWQTLPVDINYEFAAFTSSFDSNDPTINTTDPISWGIPEWVAFEIKAGALKSCSRPSLWITDETLYEAGVVPHDDTYAVEGTNELSIVSTDYRYVRGHLCPFKTATILGCDAAWNTCVMMNAVPQLQWQNNGIWKALEKDCVEWANYYKKVWVICGPVFFDKSPAVWLGQQGEVRAAVPDALFKIIIREADTETGVETIAFVIPNVVPKENELNEFVTSIGEVESLTGLTFLNALPVEKQQLEKAKHAFPPYPEGYDALSSSEKAKVRRELKKEFLKANSSLIQSWVKKENP